MAGNGGQRTLYLDVVALRNWKPAHGAGAGAVVYCMVGAVDGQGRWAVKRRTHVTAQVKVDKEVRFGGTSLEVDVGNEPMVRVLCVERRFRKREVGHVLLDMSLYTAADRIDRWFKLCSEGVPDKRGELRLRLRFAPDPPFRDEEEAAAAAGAAAGRSTPAVHAGLSGACAWFWDGVVV